jgi:hypothetical protein
MFSTEAISAGLRAVRIGAALALIAAGGAIVAGCAVATTHISQDFGSVVKEDAAAQIADPDAHYVGKPAPGANGARAALAVGRYEHDTVTKPSTAQTSSVGGGAGGGGGENGGGGSQ